MIDRLRAVLARPLRVSKRAWLLTIVATVAVGAAVAVAALNAGPDRDRPRAQRQVPAPTGSTVPYVEAPGEESHPLEPARAVDVEASKRAARRFLAAYLPFTYGRGDARELPAAAPQLRAVLASEPPRVPATERDRVPRVVLLQSNGVSHDAAELVAIVDDGAGHYSVHLRLVNTASGWLVIGLGP